MHLSTLIHNWITSKKLSALIACKKKEEKQQVIAKPKISKKSRLVFTDIQRRTLRAVFQETQRPSKESQSHIAKHLGLEVSTVSNFFMNARRRCGDRWKMEDNCVKTSSAIRQVPTLQHASALNISAANNLNVIGLNCPAIPLWSHKFFEQFCLQMRNWDIFVASKYLKFYSLTF